MAEGIRIDPMANPKGVLRLCELCEKPAYIQCAHCRVTYYCDRDHQLVDWTGIHEKICQLLIPLRTPTPFFSSEEERLHRKHQLIMRQKHMIELTRTASQKLLFETRYREAVPAAMQCLRFTIDLHGLASIELVPSYLMLSEASIGVGKLKAAQEYLSQAEWTVAKSVECPNSIRHMVHRSLGLLYIAKGDLDRARRELATDIYLATVHYGIHAIQTSGGYFHMANVFYQLDDIPTANSFYEQVTDIWHDYLSRLVRSRLESPKIVSALSALQDDAPSDKEGDIDEAQQAEAMVVLNAIYERRVKHGGRSECVAKVAHAAAMLYYLLYDIDKAKEFGRRAVGASAGIQDEDFSRSIVDFLKVCENVKVMIE